MMNVKSNSTYITKKIQCRRSQVLQEKTLRLN